MITVVQGEQVFVPYYVTSWPNVNYHTGLSFRNENATALSVCKVLGCDCGISKQVEMSLIFACVMHFLTCTLVLLI